MPYGPRRHGSKPRAREIRHLARAAKDWRTLLAEYRLAHGRDLQPVRRKSGSVYPPSGSRCEGCGAPEAWLYVNDGVKRSQLRCKICNELSPVRRVRRNNRTAYGCPHCNTALYRKTQRRYSVR